MLDKVRLDCAPEVRQKFLGLPKVRIGAPDGQ